MDLTKSSTTIFILIILVIVNCITITLQQNFDDEIYDKPTTTSAPLIKTPTTTKFVNDLVDDENDSIDDDDSTGDDDDDSNDELITTSSTTTTKISTTIKLKRQTIDTTTTTTTSIPTTTITATPDPFADFESGDIITDDDLRKISSIINLSDNDHEKREKLKKFSTKLNKFKTIIDDNQGRIRLEFLLDEFIPDPIRVRDIPIAKEDGWLTTYNGEFTNVYMYGIHNLYIESIRANIGELNAKIILSITDIFLTGNYTLDGSVSFVSINGNGEFRFNITDMLINVYGNLKSSNDQQNLYIEEIDIDMKATDVNLDLENFEVLGSEIIAQTIISTLSDIIFNQVKYTIQNKISIKIQKLINKRLSTIELNKFLSINDNLNLFDQIIKTINKRIISKKLEPIMLEKKFEKNLKIKLLQLIPINVIIEIFNGKLYGLSTFKRMGNIFIIYENDTVIIEANVGFFNLTGSYDWNINLLGNDDSIINGTSSLAINNVTAFLRIKQPMIRHSQLKFDEFYIKNISYIWIEMNGGLGVWNHLFELLINSISNIFRIQISNVITFTMKKLLQQSFEQTEFSVIP